MSTVSRTPSGGTLRAHTTAPCRQNWDNQRWSFQTGDSCPISKYTG